MNYSFIIELIIGIVLLVFNKQFAAYFIYLTALQASFLTKKKSKEIYKDYKKNNFFFWSLRIILYLAGLLLTFIGVNEVFF